MNYIKNKMLVDSNNKIFLDVNEEIFLTTDKRLNLFSYNDYVNAVNSNISTKVVKLYVLNDDETPARDISEYLMSGNVSYNYQSGQTHSLSITLSNFENTFETVPTMNLTSFNGNLFVFNDERWGVVENNIDYRSKIILWRGTKMRLDIGLYFNGTVFWKQCGIFVVDETKKNGQPDNTISVQLYDKFGLLDGTIGGNIDNDFTINVGTDIQTALTQCLNYEDRYGNIFDSKPIIFECNINGVKTPYTISKTGNLTIGEIIIELAKMISCDVFYNQNGNLVVRTGVDENPLENQPISWYFIDNQLQYHSSFVSIKGGSIINRCIVRGMIQNGKQFKGVAENKNPYSPTNVMFNPILSITIEDENIYTDALAEERAKYELQKNNFKHLSQGFSSVFVPHLQFKDVISWTDREQGVIDGRYVLTSISFPLDGGNLMSLNMSKISEVA